ncbi:MAG: AAA family ATPase [Hyphomicrobiales bacterium]|nr:AAA family ATPase [Hyphomicrobiales bacterium]MCP5001169.1 AAA family ATPase [Hyphomicrobiales bacterium]
MYLRSMSAENYRSLRSIRMDLRPVNLFVGTNGAGKSNLYRSLQLIKAAADGRFSHAIAEEGGILSAIWSGGFKKHQKAQIRLAAEIVDDETGIVYHYSIDTGFKQPTAAGFNQEAQIKNEEITLDTGRRPHVLMKRKGGHISVRDENGRMSDYPEQAMTSETALYLLGDAGRYPEISTLRHIIGQWRFYHGFRSDAGSPLRRPCLAITAPLLAEDGSNIAAVLATLAHIRQDTIDLDRAVFDAFSGAALSIPVPEEYAQFGLVLPDFPQRIFQPRELSDGQIRFLALAAALLSYRRPPFIALNEPEASLHPDMLPALAGMIANASADSQVWVVTHSEAMAAAISERCGVRAKTVIRRDGATWIEGMTATGMMDDDED